LELKYQNQIQSENSRKFSKRSSFDEKIIQTDYSKNFPSSNSKIIELEEKKAKLALEGDPFMTRAKLGKSSDRWLGWAGLVGSGRGVGKVPHRYGDGDRDGDGLRSIDESILEEDLGWAEGLRRGVGGGYLGYGEGSFDVFLQGQKNDLVKDRKGLAHSNSVGGDRRLYQ
jgi:hypothetical protein